MSRKKSTRQLIGIDDIKNDSVVTADGELAFYFVHPSNLNVLPEQGVRAKVRELLGVLKGMAELELLALDSKESFQDNRQFYRQRLEEEDNPVLFSDMVLNETLYEHCAEIEETAKKRMEIIVPQLAKAYGVTEQLKAENQIEWVRQMNACVAQAEEAIKGELIYC